MSTVFCHCFQQSAFWFQIKSFWKTQPNILHFSHKRNIMNLQIACKRKVQEHILRINAKCTGAKLRINAKYPRLEEIKWIKNIYLPLRQPKIGEFHCAAYKTFAKTARSPGQNGSATAGASPMMPPAPKTAGEKARMETSRTGTSPLSEKLLFCL